MIIKNGLLKRKLRSAAWKIFNHIENNGCGEFKKNGEERFLVKFLEKLKDSKSKNVIFDIGANIGDYSALVFDLASKKNIELNMHLFEPTKKSFLQLQNRFKQEAFVINNFGASNNNCEASIYYDKEQSTLASVYQRNLDHYDLKLSIEEKIQLKRLDDYIKEHNISHIDLIKIDIEGHELHAFEGFGEFLNGDNVDYVQFEYGGANLDSGTSLLKIFEFFNSRGFSLAKVMKNGIELRDYKPFMENFMYSNYVAISDNLLK
jgi:FkbM family methyltransferase